MIVLEALDPTRRRVEFRVLGEDDVAWRAAFARAGALARQLGLDEVRLHLGAPHDPAPGGESGSTATLAHAAGRNVSPRDAAGTLGPAIVQHAAAGTGSSAGASAVEGGSHPQGGVRNRWRLHAEALEYEFEFAHAPASRDLVALWVPLALVTFGPQEDRLMQLHTGIYEICANILEHGRPRRHPCTFSVGLRLLPDRIDGFVQDGCERFDSSRPPFQGVLERVASRERRGFGIHMMLRLIDQLEHQYNATGNRLVFTKGMLP